MYYCKKCHGFVEVDEDQKLCAECGSDRIVSYDDILHRIREEDEFIIPRIMGIFAETDVLMARLPWYVPARPIFGYNSPNIGVEITLDMDSFTSPEVTKNFLIDLKEKQGFGKIFQWTMCPRCLWTVPVAEITIHGYCFFCLKREKEEEEEGESDQVSITA